MKVVAAFIVGFLAITPVANAQGCEQGYYGDCSRNNQNYRHSRNRSKTEPYYYLNHRYEYHKRDASRRGGYHERAQSVRGR